MANKKVSQLTSKPSVLNTDIIPIADPSSGQLFKTTLSALGAVIGSAVASVNGLVGVVVLDTDDIQELASPTNRWFTDTRARAALSGGTGISYNSGTGVITSSVTLASLGGVPTSRTLTINGTTLDLSADRSFSINSMVYPGAGIAVSTGSAWGTSVVNNSGNWNTAFSWGNHAGLYLPIGGGTITNSSNSTFVLNVFNNGTTDANGLYVNIGSSSTGVPFRVDKGSSPLFNIVNSGESTFSSNVIANSFVKSGGTSSQFLKADGSVDLRSFATTGNLADYLPLTGGELANTLSSAYVLTVTNNSTASGANGLNVSIATGSTGMPFKVDKGGVSLFTIDNLGAAVLKSTITAISFIKSSGTSSEFLKADGSIDSNTYYLTSNPSNYITSSSLSAYLPLSGGTLTGALIGTSGTFSGSLSTTVGNGILAGGGAYTYAPSSTRGSMQLNGSTDQILAFSTQSYIYNSSSLFRFLSSSDIDFVVNGSPRLTLKTAGNVLIATTTSSAGVFSLQVGNGSADTRAFFNPSSAFAVGFGNGVSSNWYIGVNAQTAVNGLQFHSNQLGQAAMTITTAGNLTCVGSVTATSFFESSDSRLKTLIKDNYKAKGIESVTAKLYTKNGITELGYYAQDVQAILPSAVTTGADGFLNLSYREVHTAKIARLEKEVEELKAQLNLV